MAKKTTEDFIKESIKVHNNLYTYENFIYKGALKKGIITCRIHGDFEQVCSDHLRGRGCPKCFGTFKKTNDEFINDCRKKHGDLYDYSKVNYDGYHKKVIIGCKIHGDFEQRSFAHLNGQGCPKCFGTLKKTNEEFIDKSKKIHSDKYSYLKTSYKNAKEKVIITCKKHGDFEQAAGSHLRGSGCPTCSRRISKPEIELQNFIRSLNISFKTSVVDIVGNLELDIYLPELNKAIEFNGMWWHYDRSNKYVKPKGYHAMKSKTFREKGINVLFLREDLWKKRRKDMENVIIKFLNG